MAVFCTAVFSTALFSLHCAPSAPEPSVEGCSSKRTPPVPASSSGDAPVLATIAQIQGAAHRSPWVDRYVRVGGVVTLVRDDSFYFQSEVPDADPATSEGLFVATPEGVEVVPGNRVTVTGRVVETRPGCGDCSPGDAAYDYLSVTEIASPNSVHVEALGARLPDPVLIGAAGRRSPTSTFDSDPSGDVEATGDGDFDACGDAIDFYESLEHMLVRVDGARAVGPTTSVGEIAVVGDEGRTATGLSARGGIVVRPGDSNPERILVDDALVPDPPEVDVGARFVEPVEGVMGYAKGSFKLFNSVRLVVEGANDLAREELSLGERAVNELDVATFNLENLSAADPEARFQSLADLVVGTLNSPDVLVLEEVQDDSGAADDGVVKADVTLGLLARSIEAVGGPQYQFADIAPTDGSDGGQPGGNIRVAFMVSSERGAKLVLRAGGGATTPNRVTRDGGAHLQFSPGRIDPENAAFTNSRKPLAAEISFRSNRLIVIANHFSSKGGDEPLFGRWQPPTLVSEAKREAQAHVVADFAAAVMAADPNVVLLAAGDFNDFEFSLTLASLEAAGLRNAASSLAESDRYTYVFDGNSQALDHVLVSPSVLRRGFEYDIVHVNAEFHDSLSDHDPSVIRLRLE